MLKIKNLHVSVDKKTILKGLSLAVKPGEIHAIMGPNGSGKSTTAYALAGHPFYEVTNGKVTIDKQNLLDMSPDERAQAGLFLAFQYPVAIPGVSVQNFLKTAYQHIHPTLPLSKGEARRGFRKFSVLEFRQKLQDIANKLGIDRELLKRDLNDGFSGGEKKRVEILQMSVLKPKYAILDETDSGLDIDSIKLAAKGINQTVKDNNTGCIIITHYQRILQYVKPTHVHVVIGGRIVKSGTAELVKELEKSGYKDFLNNSQLQKDFMTHNS